MLYRFCRWLNDVYPVTVFFLYIGLFGLAFMLAFLIPAAAILVLLGSIFALLPFVFVNFLLKFVLQRMTNTAAQRGVCPACDEPMEEGTCSECGMELNPT